MHEHARDTKTTLIPGMRYDDAPAAIEWLCKAFGFEKQLVVPGEPGKIAHAQLTFGNGMIMLGSGSKGEFEKYRKTPKEAGGVNTQTCYLVVRDADAHHKQAVAAGAKIVMPLQDWDHGGRGYTCLDPEGYMWSFGTYDPWAQA